MLITGKTVTVTMQNITCRFRQFSLQSDLHFFFKIYCKLFFFHFSLTDQAAIFLFRTKYCIGSSIMPFCRWKLTPAQYRSVNTREKNVSLLRCHLGFS